MKKILIYTLPLLLLFSCIGKKEGGSEATETAEANIIKITSEQFKTSGMQLGELSLQTFIDEIACRGFLIAPTDGIAKISTPIAGTVEKVLVKTGDFVNQGQVVCNVSGTEFLDLQQQFAEASANYQKAKIDYERAIVLRAENIGAGKDFTALESTYKISLASYNALKVRIQALRINPSQIENGQMYTSFPVASPISGFITKIGAVIGQYVDMQNELAEVVNVNRLQLQLSVFETNLQKLKVGQKVRFNVCGRWEQSIDATLISVGKTINPDTRAIDCIAQIGDVDRSKLVNQSYAEAKIMVDNLETKALPANAVQKEEKEYFVFVLDKQEGDKYFLKKTKVEVGKINDSYIEILSGLPEGKQVVVNGIEML
ncbi:MAG TPA: efflux RND transporter periplasmic adaptor subunit [Bacteroidales bacterium]|nr:efflux RND transporter periplasmic adaptor subunit [Bacteroidales bacterium]